MTALRAVFRFDASPAIGAGHAYRCLTLAEALSRLGWHCHGIVNGEAAATVPALQSTTALRLVSEADVVTADWLVADHYGLDAIWEAQQRRWARQILVIDDLADRPHDCDVLLDQTFGRNAADYENLVPAGCRRLVGSDYALLRPAFARARRVSLSRREANGRLRRVLVSLGATDPGNHTEVVLRGIAESGLPLAVDVVLGSAAPRLEQISAACNTLPLDATLHVDTAEMPQLMSAADLAIGAAGTSTWERCCLGLPSLVVAVAANQRLIAKQVSATGAARLLNGARPALAEEIAAALRELSGAPSILSAMSAQAATICDGRGTERVGLALAAPGRAKNGGAVALRLAEPSDETTILDWQRHPTTRQFSRNSAIPTGEEHHRWFVARLADPDCLLTMVTLDGLPAGVLRLDPMPADDATTTAPTYEVSILVGPELRGLGIALEALRFLRRWQAAAVIVATVLPGNDASATLFRNAGYVPGADGLLYCRPAEPAFTASK